MEMKGIRKVFHLFLRELINTVLAQEEGKTKFIAGFMCPGFKTIGSAVANKSKDTHVGNMPWADEIIMGCVFDKFTPILESAEKKWLKAGVIAHCANVKTFLGLVTSGLFPNPDLVASSGLLCETAPKTLDLLRELNSL